MYTRVVAQVSIDADAAEIFKYLADLKYHYLWNPPLLNISPVTKLQKGTVYKTVSMLLGIKVKGVNTVSKFVSNKELELTNSTGPLKYRVNYSLHNKEGKTVVVCATEVESSSEAFAFTKPVLKMLARRELQTDLQALKVAVENRIQPES